ncbi:restriction endonuclease subunit S [Parahaliea sp. F7430]|uniref:Restriction endonuclease subunit S n=1 Tax=Sediminihaliea albiluteola TaxID=2758564 RepID=A0A7W2TWX1_9GAMM|nr:restriction endonuclease subunit S [Sediminihaliea albiluteola]MBA6413324.1 restriction endonuclease subunit S [Sediminihaliea albiluteola]
MVPNSWASCHLGDFMEFKNGLNADKSQYGYGLKFVNVMDVFGNDILTEDKIIGRVNVAESQLEGNLLKFGDVLFNRTSETFDEIAMSAVYLDDKPAVFGGFVIRARPSNGVLAPAYSVYLFQSSRFRNQVIKLGQGAVRANIGQKDLAKVKVSIPPFPEQKKIAQILSTWDKAITTTEQLLVNSQQQKKALMQQLLTGKKRLLDDNGVRFSGEWEKVIVKDFGKVVTGSTPPKNDKSNYGSSISWATAEDFKRKYISNTKVKLTKEGASKARVVPKGSVLVTCIASIGKNAIAGEALATNQQINAVVVNQQNCNEFFYYLIEYYKHKLIAWAGTTAIPILNKTSFEKISFLTPLLEEQQKIAAVLTSVDQEIDNLEQKIEALKQEKKALMQQMLTGKRRVLVS